MGRKIRTGRDDKQVIFLIWPKRFLLPARFTGCFEVETPVSVILVILQVAGVHLERILKLVVLLKVVNTC